MKFTASAASPLKIKADCVIFLSKGNLDYELKNLDETLRDQFTELFKATNFTSEKGGLKHIYTPTLTFNQTLLVGIEGEIDKQKEISVIESAAEQCVRVGAGKILWLDFGKESKLSWMGSMIAQKMLRASYKFKHESKKESKAPFEVIYLSLIHI